MPLFYDASLPLRRHQDQGPYEVVLMVFLALGGLSTFTAAGAPHSVSTVLTGAMLVTWSLLFVAGPTLIVLGIYWRGRIVTSLGIEQVGLTFLTGGCLMYDTALILTTSRSEGYFFVSSFVTAIAVANVWRFWQIYRRMQYLVSVSHLRTGKGGK